MKNKQISIVLFSLIFLGLFLALKISYAQNYQPSANSSNSYIESGDAIAIRIIPNPEHYSISKWYDNQGFSGSPQSLIVDGYEAIRDGRTVYVNATNIKPDAKDPNLRLVYTNIYLISYNQNPSVKTTDILGQIIKNWKFNIDLQDKPGFLPSCSIAGKVCSIDADCPADQFCSASSSPQAKTCQLKVPVNCYLDSDCPQGFFCDSAKAKIIRDVKRVGQVTEIINALTAYREKFKTYPKLEAGSYLAGQSLSLWPSWQVNFLRELSLPLNFADPINRLGDCPGFDRVTCWNTATNQFYQAAGSGSNGSWVLPAGSYAYVYKYSGGQAFNFCATFEAEVKVDGLNFKLSPSIPNSAGCITDNIPNTAPRFIDSSLSGEANNEFVGWVEFYDNEQQPLSWAMYLSSSDWQLNPGGQQKAWPQAPILQGTGNTNQKKIYSSLSGKPGVYQIKIDVSDGQMTTTKILNINISNPKPFIEAENINYKLNAQQPFRYSFYFSDDNLLDFKKDFKVTLLPGTDSQLPGTDSQFNPLNFSGSAFKKQIEPAGNNRYKVSYDYLIPTSFKFPKNLEYIYNIAVTDKYGASTNKDIKINIDNNPPRLDFTCLSGARLGAAYSCYLGPRIQTDAGNQKINYTLLQNFTNLIIDQTSDPNSVFLRSNKIASKNGSRTGSIEIRSSNEYGAFSEKKLALQLNTYCGDGVRQYRQANDEQRGGIYNDGYEDCDGLDGISNNPDVKKRVASSSIDNQYACATFDSNTPYPIPNNRYCVYKSPLSGGGYCGDGYCQAKDQAGYNLENYSNCSSDCRHQCQPSCQNKACGADDGCGNICSTGDCNSGQQCKNGACIDCQSCESTLCGGTTNCGIKCLSDGICKINEVCKSGECVIIINSSNSYTPDEDNKEQDEPVQTIYCRPKGSKSADSCAIFTKEVACTRNDCLWLGPSLLELE